MSAEMSVRVARADIQRVQERGSERGEEERRKDLGMAVWATGMTAHYPIGEDAEKSV